MKKNNLLLAYILLFVVFTSCKSDNEKLQEGFALKNAENRIKWTAYKTTDKIPLEGSFTIVNIISKGEGSTIKEAVDNVEFSIPVSSLLSGAPDYNVINFFFGAMNNTEFLKGKIFLTDDSSGYADITMNGVTEKMNFTYTIETSNISIIGSVKLSQWNTDAAVTSLHTQCGMLHSGADGIVKLWDDVSLEITSSF